MFAFRSAVGYNKDGNCMEYSYKFRLYPNKTQENLVLRTFGCCRFVFNHYLAQRKESYEQTGKTMNYYVCAKDLTTLKRQEETVWLKEVDATALQCSLRDLDDAYQVIIREHIALCAFIRKMICLNLSDPFSGFAVARTALSISGRTGSWILVLVLWRSAANLTLTKSFLIPSAVVVRVARM